MFKNRKIAKEKKKSKEEEEEAEGGLQCRVYPTFG